MHRLAIIVPLVLVASSGLADHHAMQIHKVIGGVHGDKTAQAIQLRLRGFGHNLVANGRIRVFNAAGARGPVLLIDMTTNVTNPAGGDTVLICTESFKSKTSPVTVPDFTLAAPIAEGLLAAGKLTFEFNTGAPVWWALAWGGASYTGTNVVDFTNDANGNANPPFGQGLPFASNTCVQYTGAFSGASTTNLADYAISTGAAVFRNNARVDFTVKAPCPGDFNGDGFVDDSDFVIFAVAYDTLLCPDPPAGCPADLNQDGFVDDADFVLFAAAYDALLCP